MGFKSCVYPKAYHMEFVVIFFSHSKYSIFLTYFMFIILIFSYIGPPFKFYKLKTPQNLALPLLVHVFSAASGS